MSDGSNFSDDSSSDGKEEFVCNSSEKLTGDYKRNWSFEREYLNNKNKDDEEFDEILSYLPPVPQSHNSGMIPLGLLLQFASHKVSQELIVLSELIPKAYDQSKKISLVEFSFVAMNLFSKILALVKWYRYFKKYRLCTPIQYFLDQQSQIFRDTADALCGIARIELSGARLPYFEMQSALNNIWGYFEILPLAIKKRFVPEPPVSKIDQRFILSKINQIIKDRLSLISSKIPVCITDIIIKNGTVILKVSGEYEITLTLLSTAVNEKWTLLHITILVEQHDIGYGTKLVHPLQLHSIHQHLQKLMNESKNPINTMHDFMHEFCLSIQLDVIYCEAIQLIQKQYNRKLIIEKYDIEDGKLVLSYWPKYSDKKISPSQYKLIITHSKSTSFHGLRVYHLPYRSNMPQLDTNTGRLSLNTLISSTTTMRAREKLEILKKKLDKVNPAAGAFISGNSLETIKFPLLNDFNLSEDDHLSFGVNRFTGTYFCLSNILELNENILKLNDTLNNNGEIKEIQRLISNIRINLLMEKYKKIMGLNYLIVSEAVLPMKVKEFLKDKEKNKICIKFHRDLPYYSIFLFSNNFHNTVSISQYIVFKNNSDEVIILPFDEKDEDKSKNEIDYSKKLNYLWNVSSNTSNVIHLPNDIKNLILVMDMSVRHLKLTDDFKKKGVSLDPINLKKPNDSIKLKINNIPTLQTKDVELLKYIEKLSVFCDNRAKLLWPFEFYVKKIPIIADFYNHTLVEDISIQSFGKRNYILSNRTSSSSACTSASLDIISTNFIEKMAICSMLYKQVLHFSKYYYEYYKNFCSIKIFNFQKLIVAYGNKRDQLMFLTYKPSRKTYLISFGLGTTKSFADGNDEFFESQSFEYINVHNLITQYLQEMTRKEYFLKDIVQYLINTTEGLTCLFKSFKPKLMSTEAFGQVSREMIFFNQQFELELFVLDENSFQIANGTISLAIYVFDKRYVHIKDSSYGEPAILGLENFFKYHIENLISKSLFKMNQIERNNYFISSRKIYSVPLEIFKKITKINNDIDCCSILGKYIANLRSFDKLRIIFSQPKEKTISKGCNIRFNDFQRTSYCIKVVFQGATMINGSIPCKIHFTVYLEPNTFDIKAKIEYEGIFKPSDSDIQIAQEYFEKMLSNGNCPQGVYSFINILRLTYPMSFNNLALLMQLEMEPSINHYYKLSLDLVSNDHRNADQTVQYSPSFLIDEKSFRVLIPVSLRPQVRESKKSKSVDPDRLKLNVVWDIKNNKLTLHKPSTDLMKFMNDKIIKHNEMIKDNSECVIESCIRILLVDHLKEPESSI
ncbi:Mediator complex, subunit Med14 family-containing protein [Strongyloides ratti]|uniref:Mediator of RNA polymerase II transcription subunit 14 n=1 Tax=Strongyloides ratti TaxID=34506 RepID=A0A090MQT7_STRRB|nr:Mediator complex, subunit Med14 family-containing protein [Strongyloides ratti]CEF60538.1 Mediator complex, subunit Med14 family-containing protein [Strongyloides ratti]